jgi:diguanylate cyclase (GGDEF)-like protein
MQLNLLVVSYVASAVVAAAVAVVGWRRRSVAGAQTLALLMLAVAWWLAANAFEAAALDRTSKIAWSVIAYPGIESVAVLYLLFVVDWTRQNGLVTRTRIALLLIVPVISVGIAATNEWHHLLWPTVTLVDAWGVTAVYAHGPWFWIEIAYSYTLVGAGLLALVGAMYRYPAAYSTRMRLAVAGSVAPIVGSVLYVAGLEESVHADLSSIAFSVAGLVAAWAVLRAGLLDLAPVAWAKLVDTLSDAVVVLDPERKIQAFNPSATRLLGLGRESVGRAADHALDRFPELVALSNGTGDREAEIQVGPGLPEGSGPETAGSVPPGPETSAFAPADGRWTNVRITAIRDDRGRDLGCLVVLRDVTARRLAVENIRRLSLTDELTGLLNRRGFTTLAQQQMRTAMRTRNRLWLLFADLDGLKTINDRLGHEAGDRALSEIARLLRTAPFREADIVARLGGDEFAVLATEISRADGATLGQRFQNALTRANEAPGREWELSVSIGVALFDPERPQALEDLIHEADRHMYEAKHSRPGASRD